MHNDVFALDRKFLNQRPISHPVTSWNWNMRNHVPNCVEPGEKDKLVEHILM